MIEASLPGKQLLPSLGKREDGAVAVMAALLMVFFIGIVGSAIDLGMFYLTRANLQNAIDAASLAGSRALVSGVNPGQPAAAAAANQYLSLYGFVDGVNGTTVSYSYSPDPITGVTNRMQVSVVRQYNTYFLKLLGLNTIQMSNAATAEASPGMADIALTLDLTGSMKLATSNGLSELQNAVTEFINDVNPNTSNPTGAQIAMAQWAGIKCGWDRNTAKNSNETNINLGPTTWLGSNTTEYVAPCADDKTVLSNLTMNKTTLLNLASGNQAVPCGVGMSNCYSLQSWYYQAKSVNSSDMAQGMTYNGSSCCFGTNPTYTGTKEPNAITVISNSNYYAWSTANCGRNLGATLPAGCPNAGTAPGNAHKVLVLITDGNDELWPVNGMPASTDSVGCSVASAVPQIDYNFLPPPYGNTPWGCWDQKTIDLANQLKLGPSGIAGNPDNVEIYTIAFMCVPYSSSFNSGGNQNWCTSQMAGKGGQGSHPCPSGPWDITKASRTDVFLWEVSSSSPGTCDHYFPISKSDQLPPYFKQIAGSIARGKLVG
ncbi:MAG TPA: TadE/TadG family type IV pilus assembly protein [Chloroflexota bacterium]|nr:TadE/TadG family type IV pilus assembly protein [Chloroflexota bacterium]